MAPARDIAFIRKLCALGLPAQTLAQSLLPALRGLIPAHSAGIFWVDERGEMTSLYAERLLPPEAMAAYHERHYQRQAAGFAEAFRRRSEGLDPVTTHSFSEAEQRNDYFRDVLQPLDAYHVLYGVLRDGARPFAQVSLYRGAADRLFDRSDAATLRSLLRYLASGLGRTPERSPADDASVVVEEELGVVGPGGSIVSGPEPWRRLLRLAVLSQVAPSGATREQQVVDEFLLRLYGDTTRAPVSASGNGSRPRRDVARDTPWGRFSLRSFMLRDAQGRRREQVGLLIRREEPRSLSLVRGTGSTGLSPQQREVALLLAQGRSNREIADALGLTLNTANYHVKQVYARLGVNERTAVGEMLLRLAQGATGA